MSSFSQKTVANNLLDDFCDLNFFGRGEPLHLHSLDCCLPLDRVYGSKFHSQLRDGSKFPQDPDEIGPKMECEISTRSRFWTALRHLGTHLAESVLISKISWIISAYRQGFCYIFGGRFSIVQDHGMTGIHVFWNCHLSWSHRTFSYSVLKYPVLKLAIQFLAVE
jgi:hypothetical protein